MIKDSRILLLLTLVLALTTSAHQVPSAPANLQAPATAPKADPRVMTVQFESKLVAKTLPYQVLLPVAYDQPESKTKRYAVVYLLHGLTGHYTNWFEKTKLADYAAAYDLIVVTPEGNDNWYSDSVTVATDKYESYVVQELIPDVQRRYRTIETREGRAIAGLSMGGYGSLKFGVKYPEMFTFAGSMSGALDAASWTAAELAPFQFILRSLQPVFGPDDHPGRAANDLKKLFRSVPADKISGLPTLYLDCGTEDPLLPVNRALADVLLQKKIPHEYRQLPGTHNWTYWNAQVREVLRLAAQKTGACNGHC
jgi:putative tributyrin esterase